jgi:hypothetical protein
MITLETINDSNFEEFLASPSVFLFLGKTDCEACNIWTNELLTNIDSFEGLRFGKVTIGSPGLTNFKRVHGAWLSQARELPYNTIWVNGEKQKEWPGGGLDRLKSRLVNLGLIKT